MSLHLPDKWVWDFWIAERTASPTGETEFHAFYLQAPRELGDPQLRHHFASIGHAVSSDLRNWRILPDALGPGRPGDFDDLATWTGCVINDGSQWHMFYTGIAHADNGAVQRVGYASSEDMIAWRKRGLVLEADPRFYERLHPEVVEEAWRDPWVWRDESSGKYQMLLTARVNYGPLDERGVIGYATADSLDHWEIAEPVSVPGDFYHLEVPQLVTVDGYDHIIFCTTADRHSRRRQSAAGFTAEGGIHYLTASGPDGLFHLAPGRFLLGDAKASYYAGKLLKYDGQWQLLAWEQFDNDGEFVGDLADPIPLISEPGGTLRLGHWQHNVGQHLP